jgi:endoglucanase
VTTSGTHLLLDGRPWYLYGASTYGTSNPGGQQSIAAEISLASDAGLNTLRLVDMIDTRGVDPNAPYDEAAWTHVDQLLATMHTAGLHAILDLSAFRNHLQNRELYLRGRDAIASGYPIPSECDGRSGDELDRCVGARWCIENAASCTDPYSTDMSGAWDSFLQSVATRVNTATGLQYRSDPTIAIVSFAGEPNPPNSGEPLKPSTQELTDFYARVFNQWKAYDSNHLVTSGGLLHIDWEELYGGSSGIDYQAIFSLPNQDVLSIHNYFGHFPATAANDTKTSKVATAAANVGKPWITEEFGFLQQPVDNSTTPPTTYTEADRGAWYRNVYEIQRSPPAGVPSAGVAFWNLGPEVASGSHDVNPATPATWDAVRRYAPSGPGWQAAQTLSEATARAFEPQLASDGSGRATLTWDSYDPGNPLAGSKLLAADRPGGGAWQTLPPISTGSVPQSTSLAANGAGAAVVAWVQGFSVYASYRPAGGGWAVPTQLGSGSNGVYFPSAAIDSDGEAVVAWSMSTNPSTTFVQTRIRNVDGTWSATETQPSGPRTIDGKPHVAYDANGEAVLIWQSLDGAGYADILASSHPSGGAWTAPVRLSAPSTSVDDPSLAGNGNGTVVATWIDITRVEADVRVGGSWGSPTALASMQSSLAEEPRAAIDSAGDVTVVWNRNDGSSWRTEASSRPAGGPWQAVADTLATNTPGQSEVEAAADPDGDVVAAWRHSDGSKIRIEASRKPAGRSWQPLPDLVSPPGIDADSPAVAIDTSGLAVVAWTVPGAGGNPVVQAAVSYRTAPGVYLRTPSDGATFAQGASVYADYACSDEPDASDIASCAGTVPNGARIDTSTAGPHSLTVTATDLAGTTTSVTHRYTVSQPAAIHVVGTQIVDASGAPLVLRGVDYSGTEYMCVQDSPTPSTHGRGIFEGPTNTPTPPDAMSAWNINAVRLPLNEDCWLGINGVDPSYGGASYRQALTNYVNALVAHGIVPILELSGAAPGTTLAGGDQQPMPDRDHSIDFWRDVAATFKDDGRVVFDLFNEPFPDGNHDTVAAWTCWRDGGSACLPGLTYDAVGMQELVNTVRAMGAPNLILLGGVQFARINANWLTYRPSDSADNLAASWHLYPNSYCPTQSCWDTQFQPFLSQTAAVATEIGQGGAPPCGVDFLDRAMVWLDAHSQGYFAWTWDAWGDCLSLIANWGDSAPPYAPTSPYGRTYHDHLLGIPQPPTGVVAAAGDRTAAVSWAAPADHGSSAITSYLVTPLDQTAGSDGAAVPTTGTSATIGDLTNGHVYTFSVTATNAAGTGAPSVASNAVTPKLGYPTPAAATGTASPTTATTVTTGSDPAATGGTATSITVPSGTSGGTVSVVQTGTTVPAPVGYQFGSVQVDVSAPAATATNPLTLVFTMAPPADQAPPPDPVTLSSAEIYRTEGTGTPTLVPDCTGPVGQAQPDGSPCLTSRQYVTINAHTYIQVTVLSASASHWNSARPKAGAVSVSGRGYSPQKVTVQPGAYVNWSFADGQSHSVTDSVGLGSAGSPWFDSGVKNSGGYRFAFSAAGTFSYKSTAKKDPISGAVLVPVVVTPAQGRTATSFSVIWSTRALSGYGFDVQYRFKPADSKKWTNWTNWKSGVATTSATYVPGQGPGTYAFRALLRNSSTGRTSAYSPDSSISVS